MGGDLIKHVVEEAHTCADLVHARFVQPYLNLDVRFFGFAGDFRVARRAVADVADGFVEQFFCDVSFGLLLLSFPL